MQGTVELQFHLSPHEVSQSSPVPHSTASVDFDSADANPSSTIEPEFVSFSALEQRLKNEESNWEKLVENDVKAKVKLDDLKAIESEDEASEEEEEEEEEEVQESKDQEEQEETKVENGDEVLKVEEASVNDEEANEEANEEADEEASVNEEASLKNEDFGVVANGDMKEESEEKELKHDDRIEVEKLEQNEGFSPELTSDTEPPTIRYSRPLV